MKFFTSSIKLGLVFLVCFLLLNIVAQQQLIDKYEIDFKLYHTTDALFKEVEELKKSCKLFKETRFKDIASPNDQKNSSAELLNDLRYYDFDDQSVKTNKEKAYVLTGEHPREMIAPEIVLYFMKKLCNKGTKENEMLKKFVIRIILNANPIGRRKVEKGDYCNRGNGIGVDLNRNWDFNWGKDITMIEEKPGSKAFSEIETRFIKDTVISFKPLMFLSIHSGIFGLFHPYAYMSANNNKMTQKENRRIEAMNKILNEVKNKNCKLCFVGKPHVHLGYNSSGTCIDYIFSKLGVKYSMAWEVFTNETKWKELEDYRTMFKVKKAFFIEKGEGELEFEPKDLISRNLRNQQTLSPNKRKMLFEDPANKRKKVPYSPNESENNSCVTLFNPLDTAGYNFAVRNWSDALVTLLEGVYADNKASKAKY